MKLFTVRHGNNSFEIAVLPQDTVKQLKVKCLKKMGGGCPWCNLYLASERPVRGKGLLSWSGQLPDSMDDAMMNQFNLLKTTQDIHFVVSPCDRPPTTTVKPRARLSDNSFGPGRQPGQRRGQQPGQRRGKNHSTTPPAFLYDPTDFPSLGT